MATETDTEPSINQLRERMVEAFRRYNGTDTMTPAREVAWNAYVTAREQFLRASAALKGWRYEPLKVILEH